MYRCQLCKIVSRPGQSRLVHCLHRTIPYRKIDKYGVVTTQQRTEIRKEVEVCETCKTLLDSGLSMAQVVYETKKEKEAKKELKVSKIVSKMRANQKLVEKGVKK